VYALGRVALVVALLAAACGGAASTSAPATVTVTMDDKAIRLDTATAPSGTVTFKVVNAGTVVHSLQLLQTDAPHDKIPPDPNDASKVLQTGLLRETGPLAAGQTKELAVKLAVGSYVLVCNEPAHYIVGMHTAFTVR
jgi:uncharacterized cupredoxin-like copper-binding protein